MKQCLHIIADANIPGLDETFGRHGEVQRLPGRSLHAALLARADVLLVRSVTRVDEELLRGSPVRFVGSATIGTDHLDTDWLDRQGITWAAAPGCNADAAAQYTLAMLLLACRRLGRDYRAQRVGIIGRGNVGTRLLQLLDILGVSALACDPPLAEQGQTGLVDLDQVLAEGSARCSQLRRQQDGDAPGVACLRLRPVPRRVLLQGGRKAPDLSLAKGPQGG
jgi:erythronate-4-phosphate dehydrogenase